ncbi:MAG: hypothetical protein AAGG01_01270 [Planctomycetota bacterium]
MKISCLRSAVALTLSAGVLTGLCLGAPQANRVVFVRGAPGTGGFLGGGSDEQLSDVGNFSTNGGNHGFGQLALLLEGEGFTVEQIIESTTGAPVNFDALDLATVSVLVLGSNNQTYSDADVELVKEFVFQGGGLLVISDANWGSDWDRAPSSDQVFLDPFGLVMNQDTSTYVSRASDGDHLVPVDPILKGQGLAVSLGDDVAAFDGEGVSPLTVGPTPSGVRVEILARAENNVRQNDAQGSGTIRPAGPLDAALVVAYFGEGAVVGHFDRNTFFNENGAGTDLTRFDNAQYARNLFRFLSGPVPQPYGSPKVNSEGGEARVVATRSASGVNLSVYGALPGVPTYFVVGTERDAQPFFGGDLLVGGNLSRLTLGLTDTSGQWNEPLPLTTGSGVPATLTFQLLYRDSGDPTGYGISSAVETMNGL